MPIELRGYDAAVFIADMERTNKAIRKNGGVRGKTVLDKMNERIVNRNNPEALEQMRVDRWKRENVRSAFIIEFLKANYPDSGYAERYEASNEWAKPLMYPTEESKGCEYLDEDGRHCKMKREGTGCYTCCFVCYTPAMCGSTNCPLLPEDRKPIKNI